MPHPTRRTAACRLESTDVHALAIRSGLGDGVRGRTTSSRAGRCDGRRGADGSRRRGLSTVGEWRAPRPALRNGDLLRVPRDDRRRGAPARVLGVGRRRDAGHDRCHATGVAMTAFADSAASLAMSGEGAAATTVDVMVVGAGPAGIAAAVRAAEARRRVIVLDEAPNVGGQIWRHRSRDTLGAEARSWVDRLSQTTAEVRRGVAVVDVVVGGDDAPIVVVAERHRGGAEVIRASALVIATGARERFVPFPGWTLPGVMGIGGAQAL